MKKIPCLKCGGKVSHMFGQRLVCVDCGEQFKYHRIKRMKRRLEKKCITCGKKFNNSHSSVLNCSKNCSIKYRKKWFRKYNKNHKKEIEASRQKYKRKKLQSLKKTARKKVKINKIAS